MSDIDTQLEGDFASKLVLAAEVESSPTPNTGPYVLVMLNPDNEHLEMRIGPGVDDIEALKMLTEATANFARNL